MRRLCMLSPAIAAVLWCAPAEGGESYDDLESAFTKAEKQFFEKAAGPDIDWKRHPVHEFLPRFHKLAENHAGKAEAVPALVWILSNANTLRYSDEDAAEKAVDWAMGRIMKDHVGHLSADDLKSRFQYLVFSVDKEKLVNLYEALLTQRSEKDVRGRAMFNLAFTLSSDFSSRGDADPKRVESDRGRAKTLFYKIQKEFAGTEVVKAAVPFIFEIERLQVGMTAPEIEGEGADGKPVKLSQFRGQVVVLDFWGFW